MWRGRRLRSRLDDAQLEALPIDPRRLALFGVVDKLRAFVLLGLVAFLILAITSLLITLHLLDLEQASGYELYDAMRLDIIGSSVVFLAQRFGQNYAAAAAVYLAVLLLYLPWRPDQMAAAFNKVSGLPDQQVAERG
jgi:hypothetical protein